MSTDNTNHTNIEALEGQARQIAGLLDVHAKRLSMRTMKRLEDSRARAVKAHAQQAGMTVNADGTANHLSVWLINHRIIAASLALSIIASGFMVFGNLNMQESGDAFILGADLPPEAFVDRGFEPSLNKQKKYL